MVQSRSQQIEDVENYVKLHTERIAAILQKRSRDGRVFTGVIEQAELNELRTNAIYLSYFTEILTQLRHEYSDAVVSKPRLK